MRTSDKSRHERATGTPPRDGGDPASIPTWVTRAVVYQIMTDRFANGNPANDPPGTRPWGQRPSRSSFFGGDLAGIRQKLDYLQDLGVDTLYLTPIFTAPSTHKYDASDYFSIDPALGTLSEFQQLLSDLHRRGMRLMLDGVFNHCGDRHPAFEAAVRQGPGSPTWNWYFFKGYPVRRRPSPNYRHAGIYYLPKWNLSNVEVRAHLQKAIRFWTELGIDGWRLDVPWYVEEHAFWQEMRELVRSINPEAYLVGEHWGDAAPWLQGDQFDGATDYRLRDAILGFVTPGSGKLTGQETGERLSFLAQAYNRPHRLAMWNLLGSHDTPRVATQLRGSLPRLALAFTMAFTFPGVPQLYYGDELALRGGNDPDCRRCFPWDRVASGHPVRTLIQQLIRLRRVHPALQTGSWNLLHAEGGIVAYQRSFGNDVVLFVGADGTGEGSFTLPPLGSGTEQADASPELAGLWSDALADAWPGGDRSLHKTWTAGTTLRNGREARAYLFVRP